MKPPKKPYTPPKLSYLGTVAELTQTAGTVLQAEPLFNQTPKTRP
jgi:hypothetical protein